MLFEQVLIYIYYNLLLFEVKAAQIYVSSVCQKILSYVTK